MILGKALILKGLGGITACAAPIVGIVGHNKGWWTLSKKTPENTQEADPEANTLISSVGLTCTSSNNSEETCTTTTGGTLKLKQENNTSENITLQTSSAKIFLYRNDSTNTYKSNLKFVIEGGDISLSGGESSSITKLEEFETYQMEKSGDKWYLSRKEKASDEIRRTLGLPEGCSFPTSDSENTSCTIPSTDIDGVNFLGKSGTVTNTSSSSLSLTITKVSDTTNYPLGYKFSFQASGSEVSISTSNDPITFKTNESTEFKINRSGNRNKDLKLEKVLTLGDLLKEVGLTTCTSTENSNNECSIGNSGIKVKQDTTKKEESKTKSSGSGKIKVYSDNTYNKGFKFVIEEGDITLSSGTISKLEEFETYEIKKNEDDSKWYLTRKTDAIDEKSKSLGLPTEDSTCKLPSTGSTTCQLDEAKLKKVNFDGKGESGASIDNGGTVTLTISKVDSSDSNFSTGGYKFAFQSEKDITISSTSPAKYIKKNTNTEFKIKETTATGSAKTLSLEKAWTVTTLAQKAGLTCCESGSKECSLPTSEDLKLYNSSEDKTENGKVNESDSSKKLKYEEDVEGHNQGFKFYVDEEVTLSDNSKKIEKDNATYEIKEIEGKWYLSKKETTNGGSGS